MTQRRTKLEMALQSAIDGARRSQAHVGAEGAREKLQQLVVSLEQALTDVRQDREAQVLGLARWTADWIPDVHDPLVGALDEVERFAIEGT